MEPKVKREERMAGPVVEPTASSAESLIKFIVYAQRSSRMFCLKKLRGPALLELEPYALQARD